MKGCAEMREYVLRILRSAEGDDLERAERAFRGWSEEAMNMPYGYSDKTPNDLLAGYRKEREELKAAQAWLTQIVIVK